MALAVMKSPVPPAININRLKLLLRRSLFSELGVSLLSSSMVMIAGTAQAIIP